MTISKNIKNNSSLFYWRISSFFILLLLCFSLEYSYAQSSEYELKSIIIWKITEYVEWPENAGMNDKSTPVIIGVIGENPFETALQDLYLSGKQTIKGKPVEVVYITEFNQINNCDILFIGTSEEKNLSDILLNTKGKSILTIGDTKNFGESGVHINFYISKNQTRFELNESAITENGFTIDYHLLNISRIVGTKKVRN